MKGEWTPERSDRAWRWVYGLLIFAAFAQAFAAFAQAFAAFATYMGSR